MTPLDLFDPAAAEWRPIANEEIPVPRYAMNSLEPPDDDTDAWEAYLASDQYVTDAVERYQDTPRCWQSFDDWRSGGRVA